MQTFALLDSAMQVLSPLPLANYMLLTLTVTTLLAFQAHRELHVYINYGPEGLTFDLVSSSSLWLR